MLRRVLLKDYWYFYVFFLIENKVCCERCFIMVMLIVLDYDYCLMELFGNDFKIEILLCLGIMKLWNKWKEVICFREDFDGEILFIDEFINLEELFSFLFFVYSLDSGLDVGIEDFLIDFVLLWVDEDFGLNDYDIRDLEEFLNFNE